MKYYAGIGSRTTPGHILMAMNQIGEQLSDLGYILRSGGAIGADRAFEAMVVDPTKKEIFRPGDASPKARELASQFHPNWPACSDYAKNLHGRNAQIILGRDLDQPVLFVVCWTPEPMVTGGTRLGVKIAESRGIPVFNLFNEQRALGLQSFMKGLAGGPSCR